MRLRLRRTPDPIACIELVEIVTEYLEGTMADRQRRAFEHHLGLCDGCASYVEQMRATIRLSGALRTEDVPKEGVEELLAAFRAYRSQRSS
jgi:anti-sigma factor RsiW